MEVHTQTSIEDHLISSLNFKASSGTASYVTASRMVRYFCESGDTFGPNNRTIRFRLNDAAFLDLESLRLGMTIHNNTGLSVDGTPMPLEPISNPLAMFSRCRAYVAGQLVEDITECGTVAVLLERLKSTNRRFNDSYENFVMTGTDENHTPIGAGLARKTITKLPFGICAQNKWMPLSQVASGGLLIELELSSKATQGFKEEALNTISWSVKDVFLHAMAYDVDSSINNSIVEHISSGSALPYHLTSMFATKHFVSQSNFTLSLQRSATRCKQVYAIIYKANSPITSFHHPVGDNPSHINAANNADTLQYQLQIGSRKWPETAVDSVQETYMRLRQAAGIFYGSDSLTAGVTANDFTNGRAVYSIDLEKTGAQALMTGVSTQGQTLTIDFRNTGCTVGDFVVVVQVNDVILNLRSGAADVLE